MALKPCKECGKEISTEAKVCPNCGKKNPTTSAFTPTGGAAGCLVIVVLIAIASAIGSRGTSLPRPDASAVRDTSAHIPSRSERLATIQKTTAAATTVSGTRCSRATKTRISNLLAQHPEWDDDVIGTVACGWIQEGLTKDQVIASWGKPDHINRSGGSYGVHEQWVYHDGSSYVYVEGGVVTSWQTTH